MLEAKAKYQGHKRKCSPKKKKKKKKKRSSQKVFRQSQNQKFFQALHKVLTIQKIVPIFEDLKPRGQGQGLDLRGQGLQNVSSRTPPLLSMIDNLRQN